MNIEVIKNKYKYRFVVCSNCDSELKINKDGILYHYVKGYDIATIKCPCCNKQFTIKR